MLALFRNLRWDGRARLAGILDLLQGRAARNAAAARFPRPAPPGGTATLTSRCSAVQVPLPG